MSLARKFCVSVFFLLVFRATCLPPIAAAAEDKTIGVVISEIVPDDHISGWVVNMAAEQTSKYKVLVYVKTDKWYIHPYASGGEGLSFAKVEDDGHFRIKTVKREFSADTVSAFVVPVDFAAPAQAMDLGSVKSASVASVSQDGKGRL